MSVDIVGRSLLVATAPSPGSLPVVGGLLDAVTGIVTGTIYGIGGAPSAVACPLLTPVCGTVPIPGH